MTNLGKAAVAGLAGGLAGAFAMSEFSRVWERAVPGGSGSPRRSKVIAFHQRGCGGMHASQQEWDSTLSAATAVVRLLRMTVNDVCRRRGAVTVHYAVGAGMGAAYAVLCECLPPAAAGWGAVFGVGVWLVLDEAGMPLLGWTRSPLKYSPTQHANSFGEHLAYGVTTDLVRRLLRRAW